MPARVTQFILCSFAHICTATLTSFHIFHHLYTSYIPLGAKLILSPRREKNKLIQTSHKIMRRLFRPNKEEVRNASRKLHMEVFHTYCSCPCIIRAIKQGGADMGTTYTNLGEIIKYTEFQLDNLMSPLMPLCMVTDNVKVCMCGMRSNYS
jgi:hypothetical protein